VAVLRKSLVIVDVVAMISVPPPWRFLQRDRLDALATHFFQEVGIADLVARRRTPVKLLENSEQHQGYHQPHSDFREPLIVHRGSFSSSAVPHVGHDAPDSTAYRGDSSSDKAFHRFTGGPCRRAAKRGAFARISAAEQPHVNVL
jgi:hypothetical protein